LIIVMRHIFGTFIGIAVTPVLIFGSGWAYTKLSPSRDMSLPLVGVVPYFKYLRGSYPGLLMMVVLALLLGLLVATWRLSPSAAVIPALMLLGWTALYAATPEYALGLVYPQPFESEGSVISGGVGRGQQQLLSGGTYALIGSLLFVPALLPVRWKGDSGIRPVRWRTWHGILLGAVVTPLSAWVLAWARSELLGTYQDGTGVHHLGLGHLPALMVMAAVGLMLGCLIAARRIPPMTTLVPGLVFVGWTAWFIVDIEKAVKIAPDYPSEYERILGIPEGIMGYQFLLAEHVYLMVGFTLVVAALLPAQWRTARDTDHLTDHVQPSTPR